jgi:hypothetical protein
MAGASSRTRVQVACEEETEDLWAILSQPRVKRNTSQSRSPVRQSRSSRTERNRSRLRRHTRHQSANPTIAPSRAVRVSGVYTDSCTVQAIWTETLDNLPPERSEFLALILNRLGRREPTVSVQGRRKGFLARREIRAQPHSCRESGLEDQPESFGAGLF